MKIGINLATIPWGNKFEKLSTIAEEIQTDEVEFPIQLWLEHGCHPQILGPLNICNVSGILHRTNIFPESIFTTQNNFEKQVDQLEKKLQAVKGLRCSAMSLGIDPWVSLPPKEAQGMFLERVSYLATKLSEYNFTLNLEYISHKISSPSDMSTHLFCPSLPAALSLIERLKLDSVKLLLDVIHWFADGMSIEPKDLTDIIGLVHLCDYPHQNTDQISDLNRLLPFEGKLPVDKFLSSLNKGRYDGAATIEVFRTDFYQPTLHQVKKAISKCK